MIRFETQSRRRPSHALGPARFKLPLRRPEDRHLAARLLVEARRINRSCAWRKRSWTQHLDVAASFALQYAQAATEEDCEEVDEALERVFDRIALVMEETGSMTRLWSH